MLRKMNKILIFLYPVLSFMALTGLVFLFIMLFHSKSSAQGSLSAIERRELLLEEQRINIEKDRQALNRDCSKVSSGDTAKRQECQKRYDDIMGRMKQYKADLDSLAKQKAALKKEGIIISQGQPVSKKQSPGKVSPADLAALKKAITWPGPWTEKQKDITVKALSGFNDKKLRDWVATKVNFELVTDPGLKGKGPSPWAGEDKLFFSDYFFDPQISHARKENLIAFEAGKALLLGEGKNLENWFNKTIGKKQSLIWELKNSKHNDDEDLSFLIDSPSQTDSGFGYLFRAQALGLKASTSGGQEAQREFKKHIDPFLRGKR